MENKKLLVLTNNESEKIYIAKIYWILFFLLLTIGAISIILLIINGNYFDYLHANSIFITLITIYIVYLVVGILIFFKPSKYTYLLFIVTLLSPAYLGIYNWGILHTHSILLFTTGIQLTYFLLNGQFRKAVIAISVSILLITSSLQLIGTIHYDYITPSLYIHIPDLIIIAFLITANLFGISIYYKSTIANIQKATKLNRQLQQQNFKLKLSLVKEIHKKLSLKEKLSDIQEENIEQTYTNTLKHIENNLNLLNKETYHRLNAQDFIHQISNILQRLAFTHSNGKPHIDESNFKEIQSVLKKYKHTLIQTENIQKKFNLSNLLYELKRENESKKLSINLNISNNIYIKGSKDKLSHVFLNLFLNSINARATKITVTAVKEENFITLLISDNGVGISKKKLLNLQKRLKKQKYGRYNLREDKGLGLGLITSKQILETYFGGSLKIKSKEKYITIILNVIIT